VGYAGPKARLVVRNPLQIIERSLMAFAMLVFAASLEPCSSIFTFLARAVANPEFPQ
jgi:hypothetical protein